MVALAQNLALPRCPHCGIAKPLLTKIHQHESKDHSGINHRIWYVYQCTHCGSLVTAFSKGHKGVALGGRPAAIAYDKEASGWYPRSEDVDIDLPDRARLFLQQAVESMHAPAGAVMLCASSVDAMLKERGYKEGSLYRRIDTAVEDHILTKEMGQWAHAVRLDANDQRHADEEAGLPTEGDARRCIDFAMALGQILFTLPARVQRGLQE